jgi:tight adherence protein B
VTTWLFLLAALVVLPAIPATGLPTTPIGWPAGWRRFPGRRRSQRSRSRTEAIAWVLALAGELRAGNPALQAVQTSTQRHGVAPRAARAARLGGDVAAALRADAQESGATLLSAVASFWDLAQSSGAGMATALERTADGYRQSLAVRRTLDVELAAPRATARMMSLLPAIGVGFAMLLGADPLRWLTTTVPGLFCLVAGFGANMCGFLWIRQIVRRLEAGL